MDPELNLWLWLLFLIPRCSALLKAQWKVVLPFLSLFNLLSHHHPLIPMPHCQQPRFFPPSWTRASLLFPWPGSSCPSPHLRFLQGSMYLNYRLLHFVRHSASGLHVISRFLRAWTWHVLVIFVPFSLCSPPRLPVLSHNSHSVSVFGWTRKNSGMLVQVSCNTSPAHGVSNAFAISFLPSA